ncbi:MAG: M20 family metallopeptidase [Bacteroidia bacterium]|jgi:amidohydrolase
MTEQLKAEIIAKANDSFPLLQNIRRHIHAYPELSFEEEKTSAFVQKQLDAFGISYTKGWAGYGIVATIEGNAKGKTVALRADMDALPIQETNTTEYASKVPNVMHACGHDVHTTCLLGAARILNETRHQWAGTLHLIFQPGEEKIPGGARVMLEEGLFKEDKPDAIIALHVFPMLPSGKLGFRAGLYMASTDELYFKVVGKGGHGAMPSQLTDPVIAAAHFIIALQQINSRLAPPGIPTVLTIGKVIAQGATNVIPAEVLLEGTFRTMDETWREKAHAKIADIAKSCGDMFGVTIEPHIIKGCPVLINDAAVTQKARDAASELIGDTNVSDLEMRMTAEDFAWFAQKIPACFYRLGTASPDGRFTAGVHTSTFDIDETALKTGAASLSAIAIELLGN